MDDQLELLVDLHIDGDRQGPGSNEATRSAIELAGLVGRTDLAVADIGCGTGASALVLASDLDAHVTAVDFLPQFLSRLNSDAEQSGLGDRITIRTESMDELSFEDASLDVVWSEGAIYNIGFEKGIRSWRKFLKPGGVLAVSEIIWLTHQRPAELEEHWMAEYAEISTASNKLATLEAAGYSPVGYFTLPECCWLDHYYRPMQDRFPAFLKRHDGSPAANQIVEAEQHEIDLYERYSDRFGYGFFIAVRTAE